MTRRLPPRRGPSTATSPRPLLQSFRACIYPTFLAPHLLIRSSSRALLNGRCLAVRPNSHYPRLATVSCA
ncbi:hypothetical protein VFPFJ_06876 [Purpureocillium lilacinum]|uniref:Uncharacterized protein n=1 Tax=Purpureocillium lilacinum TaxID=33203 RepID=A0A179GQH3_PURLI|nr:hypothetical protein VFPFJ_06876 [Purpureocillium lilacinum]OAQ80186.1 hypothetical protein VFPBJ_05771 [Purpureocillium lilacinum]OAQ88411.1 hypothetical protein VFPFJ_06876 [Purpureocillium lilacinum]